MNWASGFYKNPSINSFFVHIFPKLMYRDWEIFEFSKIFQNAQIQKSLECLSVYHGTSQTAKLPPHGRLMIIIVPVREIQDQILIFQVSTIRRKESRRGKESSPQLSQIFRIYTGRGRGPLLPARITPSKLVTLTRSTRWRNPTLWVIHTNFLEKN